MKDTKFKKKYFLYVGNAYPHKNLERLIEAIVLLNKKQSVILKIASSRSIFTQRLERVINKLDAVKFVELLGFVPDEELRNLYKNAQAFIFPSLSEGFGIPGLEAMDMETLVIASDIPVFKEIYETNAIYFNPFNPSSIEKAMETVLQLNSGERKKRILSAKNFVKRYSWSKMAKQTLDLYEEIGKENSNSIRPGK